MLLACSGTYCCHPLVPKCGGPAVNWDPVSEPRSPNHQPRAPAVAQVSSFGKQTSMGAVPLPPASNTTQTIKNKNSGVNTNPASLSKQGKGNPEVHRSY